MGDVIALIYILAAGRFFMALAGLDAGTAVQALKNAQYKFAIKTKIVARHEAGEQA